MARGTTLSTLVSMLKAEVGHSLSVGTQVDPGFRVLLSNKQKLLAAEFNFPFLKTRWNVDATAETRYFTFPSTTITGSTASIDFEKPFKIFVQYNNRWLPVDEGIDEVEEMNVANPDTGLTDWSQVFQDPIRRWDYNGSVTTQFQVWPVPETTQKLRIVGQRALAALTAVTHTADLDDELIVLSVAADILAGSPKKEALARLQLLYAQQHLTTLRSNYQPKGRSYVLGGATRLPVYRRVYRSL